MIVDDFHIVGFAVAPPKANAPLIVDADTVLAFSIANQFLEPISAGHAEIIQCRGCM
jgi:hypothetical protein